MKRIALLLLIALMFSCEMEFLEADALGENASIVGTWIEEGYEDDATLMQRAEELDSSKYGFIIHEDGTFTEHKNSGWCGTPPISYAEFEGAWSAVSDSLLDITVGYWGGTMTYQIRILSVDQEQLKIRYLYAEDRALSR